MQLKLVTDKGKVFNYDAMECMLNHLNEVEEQKIGILLTTYLSQSRRVNGCDQGHLSGK